MIDTDSLRCPDCGAYWPAHVRKGQVVGCIEHSAALTRRSDLAAVIIRRPRTGDRLGHTLACFRECRDPVAGTILALDLDAGEGEYYEPVEDYLRNTTKRLGGLELEREKQRLEDWLGYQVRIVGR